MGGSLAIAERAGQAGTPLAIASKQAWIQGYQISLVVGSIIVVVASVIAYIFLPDKSADHIHEEGGFEVGQ